MGSLPFIPQQISTAINDLLDHCAELKEGQRVLIVAAKDGLYGGLNLVDEVTVAWTQAAVQKKGAHPYVLWMDFPSKPAVIWSEGKESLHSWRLPPVLKRAIQEADLVITHAVDLSFEEELKETQELFQKAGVPMVRNMATTAPLLMSPWGQTPYELVSEIRIKTAELIRPGLRWTIIHPNGTHIEGEVSKPARSEHYAHRRQPGIYRPFPEGVFPSISTEGAEGVAVIHETGILGARHIGVPSKFKEPVRFTIEKGFIRKIEGGEEAKKLRAFYQFVSKYLGESAYEVRGFHGGVHPSAHIAPHECPDQLYRSFIEHHHWSSFHIHLGNSRPAAEFPYNLHISGELRGGSLKVGDQFLYEEGRLTAADNPSVRAIAERYPDRPGLEPELWALQ